MSRDSPVIVGGSMEMTGALFGRGDQGHGRTEKAVYPKIF